MSGANVFDVKRFGINDGEGIRTVLFIKGCPLRCKWCQNPEGLRPDIQLWYARGGCVGCQSCVAACTHGALAFDEQGVRIDQTSCVRCGACIAACPTGALRFDAKHMDVAAALAEIERDRVFYGTEGGVTLSGGECTAVPDFSLPVLRACRERGVHTAIESCLHTPPETLDAFAAVTDKIIADIKLIDPARHKEATGVDNGLILANIRRLAEQGTQLLLRTPLIPGYTADRENLEGIAAFVAALPGKPPIELLNFNPMCREKYAALREPYGFAPEQRAFTQEEMHARREMMRAYGLQVL